jgi:SAM-dependent methyltransferase
MKKQGLSEKLYRFIFPKSYLRAIKLGKKSKSLAFALCPENFGRAVVLAQFIEQTIEIFSNNRNIRIAVVGGSDDEPEIRALKALGLKLEVSIFGIEENIQYLDLNNEPVLTQTSYGKYDLILCSQVFEHIWNHESAFKILLQLTSKDSYLWLACPASNHPHGSPSYFSAGYTSEYLSLNLNRMGLTIIAAGQIGTPRNYRATHILPTWLSVRGHSFPPLYAFEGKSAHIRILYSIKYFFANISFLWISPTITDEIGCATESWIFAQNQT